MKLTIFNQIHKELGAKMVEFAGFQMPIHYKNGIIFEHKAVRQSVGVFDVSHMGEFEIEGSDSLSFVQKVTINDASKLIPGKAQYSAMCYHDGGIVDDLIVYRLEENKFMFVVNAANIDKDFNWLLENSKGFDVKLKNVSDEINLLAVQGPNSLVSLQKLTNIELGSIPFYSFVFGKLADVDLIISRTGYTGELGFELYFRGDFELAKHIWNSIFDAGKEFNIEPVGLGCRDTLRLEKGYCLYGNDIDARTNPIEAGLGWITKLNKGQFNGSDVISKVKEEGPARRLVGFIVESSNFIPRQNHKIFTDGNEIGFVTSGNLSPILEKPIGLGYVRSEFSQPETIIEIEARGKFFPAKVVKLPFV
ncbi:MAG: glycine cleavage system aminomethyltransferase GcvT [Ignavibacteria bacterium]|nr:glycine cleavage system aminomethyltransferase GcvT [Ignavibacteria bacterium]